MALGVKKGDEKIHICDVDREVAKFWGTLDELDDSYYSSYMKKSDFTKDDKFNEFKYWSARMSSNWFDVIGYEIERAKGAINTWDDAFKSLIDRCMTYDSAKDLTRDEMENVIYKPYKDLIEHFNTLGWQPYYAN